MRSSPAKLNVFTPTIFETDCFHSKKNFLPFLAVISEKEMDPGPVKSAAFCRVPGYVKPARLGIPGSPRFLLLRLPVGTLG